jgi:hypothetical protein
MGRNDYGLGQVNQTRNNGGNSTGITELRNADSSPTKTAGAQERSLVKGDPKMQLTGMTVEENEGPNKIAPVIAQDGKDIRVDLEASMPSITEAPHGVPEETQGNQDPNDIQDQQDNGDDANDNGNDANANKDKTDREKEGGEDENNQDKADEPNDDENPDDQNDIDNDADADKNEDEGDKDVKDEPDELKDDFKKD